MDATLIIVGLVALGLGVAIGWLLWGRLLSHVCSERDDAKAESDVRRNESEDWRAKFVEAGVNLAAEAERTKRLEEVERQLVAEREAASSLRAEKAAFERGEAERESAYRTQLAQLKEFETKLETRFGELAGQAVENAHDRFLKRADEKFKATGAQNESSLKELLQPVRDTLQKYEADLRQLENDRKGAYQSLTDQIGVLREGQDRVANEALRLRTALRSSTGEVGRWGEDQCRNVLERAGLQEGIDFDEQRSSDLAGDRSKPDFIVRVPGGRQIIIDVKCSIDAFLGAADAEDDQARSKLLGDHSRAIRNHAQSLMKREYQNKFKRSSTFVVMFVPGENFLQAAIERDPKLLSDAHHGNVIIVGPTTLTSVILNVAALRDQARLAERAEQIGEMGRRLYDNLATLGKNSQSMAGAVKSLVSNWNSLVGTLDGHMLSTARKFDEYGVGKGSPSVRELERFEASVREPQRIPIEKPLVDHTDNTAAEAQGEPSANEDDAAA